MSEISHWSSDRYWTKPLERFYALRDQGENKLALDLAAILEVVYNGEGPAYKLMEAMLSVREHEALDGFRGAPRVMLALLIRLAELSKAKQGSDRLKSAVSLDNQTVGNVGLYYVCYRLSRYGWNVMPTARNAKGIDIVAYSQDGVRKLTIQVKALSKRSPVPLGGKLDHLFADFVVICRYVDRDKPECYILTPHEVKDLAHKGVKGDKISYWLQPKQYESEKFREQWEALIGSGLTGTPASSTPLT